MFSDQQNQLVSTQSPYCLVAQKKLSPSERSQAMFAIKN